MLILVYICEKENKCFFLPFFFYSVFSDRSIYIQLLSFYNFRKLEHELVVTIN
jgi:hypothetical protein